jgi:hypothetical protein
MEIIKSYIFLTSEGHTYQPNSESAEPDIENLQVIGISEGINSQMAFDNLIKNRDYLLKTTFNEIFCYELSNNFEDTVDFFLLDSERKNN